MNRVKELRTAHGISQKALAAYLGVHQTAVSQWETGRTDPDTSTAIRLAEYFNVSMDRLLGREEEEKIDDIYLDLARGARDRKLQLSKKDVDFLLDFAQHLKERDNEN